MRLTHAGHNIVAEAVESKCPYHDGRARRREESHDVTLLESIVGMHCTVVSYPHVVAEGVAPHKGHASMLSWGLMEFRVGVRRSLDYAEIRMKTLDSLEMLAGWSVQNFAYPGDHHLLFDVEVRANEVIYAFALVFPAGGSTVILDDTGFPEVLQENVL